MSLSQRSLGCSDVKSRLMRFGDALVLRESVVTRKRRIALGSICALRISLATVFRQHGTFWASSSTCTLGAPHDSRRALRDLLSRRLGATPPVRRRRVGPGLRAVSGTGGPRSVVSAARDLQRLAQGRPAVLPSILLDEGVL